MWLSWWHIPMEQKRLQPVPDHGRDTEVLDIVEQGARKRKGDAKTNNFPVWHALPKPADRGNHRQCKHRWIKRVQGELAPEVMSRPSPPRASRSAAACGAIAGWAHVEGGLPGDRFNMRERDAYHHPIDGLRSNPSRLQSTQCALAELFSSFLNSQTCATHARKRCDPHYHLIRTAKMDLRTFLMRSPDFPDIAFTDDFASDWTAQRLRKGMHLARQEETETDEFMLLEGCLASSICDQDGKEFCVGFYVGPCVVTPNIARTRNDLSLVSIVATTDCVVARIDSDVLSD